MTAFTRFQSAPASKPVIHEPIIAQYAQPAILFSPRPVAPVMAITVATTNSDAESLSLSRNNSASTSDTSAPHPALKESPRKPKSSKGNTETKLKKRLARKAELARASRRRKKAYISGLEDEIVRLKALVERMKTAAANGQTFIDDPASHAVSLSSARKARRDLREGLKAIKDAESDEESGSSGTSDDSASEEEDESNHRSSNRSIPLINVVNAMNSMEVHQKSHSAHNQQSIAVKVTYLNDTRRLTLTQSTYRSLVHSVRSLWPHLGQPVLSYIDDENDSVRITRDDELIEAVRFHRGRSIKLIVQDAQHSLNQPNNQTINDSDGGSVGSNDDLRLSRRLSQKRKHADDQLINQSKRRLSESQRSTDSNSSINSLNQYRAVPSLSVSTLAVPVYNPSVMLCLELISEMNGQFAVTRAMCSLPICSTFRSLREYLAQNFFATSPALSSSFVFLIGNTPIRTRVYDENATLLSLNFQNNDLVQFIHESLLLVPAKPDEPVNLIDAEDDAAVSAASVISTLAQATTSVKEGAQTICAASA